MSLCSRYPITFLRTRKFGSGPSSVTASFATAIVAAGCGDDEETAYCVDENDEVVGQAPRGEAYARRLRHRCVFILARDPDDRIFVHRRTAQKLVFPSMYDMFVGGVVGAGESYQEAALREAHARGRSPQPALALVWLAEGKVRAAAAAIKAALDEGLAQIKEIPVLTVSAKTGKGIDQLLGAAASARRASRIGPLEALRVCG